LLVVVDLAVLHDDDVARLVAERLLAAGHVDGGEPPNPRTPAIGEKESVVVRSAVPDGVDHPVDPVRRDGPARVVLVDAGDAAHAKALVETRDRRDASITPSRFASPQ